MMAKTDVGEGAASSPNPSRQGFQWHAMATNKHPVFDRWWCVPYSIVHYCKLYKVDARREKYLNPDWIEMGEWVESV